MDTDPTDSSDDENDSDAAAPERRDTKSQQENTHIDENCILPNVVNKTVTADDIAIANVESEQKNNDNLSKDNGNENNVDEQAIEEVLFEDNIDVTGMDTLNNCSYIV